MDKESLNKLVPEKNYGTSIEDSKPVEVIARAVRIVTQKRDIQSLLFRPDTHDDGYEVTFEYVLGEGKNRQLMRYTQSLGTGDVIPELGQYVRGIHVECQWGATRFVMTHKLKVREVPNG